MAREGSQSTIASATLATADADPKRLALVCEGAEMSYGLLGERIRRIARASRDFGLLPGDRVALIAGNRIEYLEVVAGLAEAGLAVATLNPRQTEAELRQVIEDCGARLAIVDPDLYDMVAQSAFEPLEAIVPFGARYDELLAKAKPVLPEQRRPDPGDTFSIPYTSGTTGRPKGVALSHRSRTIGFADFRREYGCYGPGKRFLAVAPFYHGAGFSLAFSALDAGGICEIVPQFDLEDFAGRLGSGRHDGAFVVPTMLRRLLDHTPAKTVAGHRLGALICNAAALPDETRDETIDRFGDGLLHEIYGSTEAGVVTSLRPEDQRRKRSCVGPAFEDAEIRLLDDRGEDVPEGEVGELFSRTATIFNGYWNRPDATEEAFRGDWFSAGDLARRDDEGYIYIEGRKKDMIVSGGVNISPREIELVLAQHPAISEVAVAGLPNREWGEEVCAFVVLRPGADVSGDELIALARSELSGAKVPKSVRFLDELPRSAAGKLLKRKLREAGDPG